MLTFREVMSGVHSDTIVLHAKAIGKPAYICNGWTKKDFPRLIEEYGDAEVFRIIRRGGRDWLGARTEQPVIYLNPDFEPRKEIMNGQRKTV